MKRFHFALRFAALAALLLFVASCAAKSPIPDPKPDWFFSDLVDYEFVQRHVAVPHSPDALIVDSRPYKPTYVNGYIPTAVSIPFKDFDKKTDMLPENKNALLIFYCGGRHCPLSHKSAAKAVKLGYTNVKVYGAGYPDWLEHGGYPAIGLERLSEMMAKGEPYMLVDARPAKKFLEGAIPSAISIPDREFEDKAGMLPSDKSVPLVFYCGGYACPLSHKSALKALDMGYKTAIVAEAGYPGWTKLYGAAAAQVKAGADEGSIDVAQFEKILAENPDSVRLIDVRDPAEFKLGSLPTAENMTVDQVEAAMKDLKADKPIVFVCATGARSGEAYYMVKDMRPDIKDVFYLEADVVYKDGKYEIHKH